SSSVSERRKDSAVHVSLSSSSLVKQPGTRWPLPSRVEGFPTPSPTMNELQSTYVDCCVTQQGEEHQWRVRSPWSVTRRRRAQWSGYRPPRPGLSTPIVNKSSHGGSSKKIQRFQPIRKAANGRIEFAPQKISKKICPPAGSGRGFGRLPGAPSPGVLPDAPRALAGGGPSRPDRALVHGRRAPSKAGPSSSQGQTWSPGACQTGFLRPAVQETFPY
ncbi:hypothetical protein ABIB94_005294, partial [Bradyrhizobium sp. JR7.2]